MDREMEIAGAASVGGWLQWKKQHAVTIGTPCANCETPIQGPYCHSCGQLAETFERSIWHLVVEAFESFFHFDGRLFHTAPRLALRPGALTRSYLDGKRASQIPPLRLFLIVLLIFFFVSGLKLTGEGASGPTVVSDDVHLSPSEKQAVLDNLGDPKAITAIVNSARAKRGLPPIAEKLDPKAGVKLNGFTAGKGSWLAKRAGAAAKNPELFRMKLEAWSERMAFLMLPIAALLLGLLFVFQRQFFLYDHLIFSMHSLSFQGLLGAAVILLSALGDWTALLLVAAPVHLFVHMRTTYGTGIVGTLVRMVLLGVGSSIGFIALITGLMLIGLANMGGH